MGVLYEYICDKCGCNFEIVQSMKDDALVECPDCNSPSLRRVFFPPIISVHKSETDPDMTLGHLADRNRSRMSEDEKAAITKVQEKRQGKVKSEKDLPRGMTRIERSPASDSPFVDNPLCPATRQEIQKMDSKQKDKYIKTGKKV